jgi:hypothetical protein
MQMRKLYLRMAVALLGFAGLSAAAKAQSADQLVVKVPFEFVLAGTTLPAGTYRVRPVSDDPTSGIVFSSYENHAIAAVLPIDMQHVYTNDPKVTFKTAGGEHFLNRIQTEENAFDIPVSKAKLTEALARNNATSLGASGSH